MIQYDINGSSLGSAYTTAVEATFRQWDWYIRLAADSGATESVIASGDQIISVDLYKGACGNLLTPGSIFVPYFEAKLSGYTFSRSLVGAKVNVIAGLYTGTNTVQYINEGYYIITEAKYQNGVWTVKGSAYMAEYLQKTYSPTQTGAQSISWYLTDIAQQMGYTTAQAIDDLTLDAVITLPGGLMYQEALGVLSSLLGAFVTDYVYGASNVQQNRLLIAPYLPSSGGGTLAVSPGRSATPPEYEEDPYEVTGVTCIVTADQEDPDGTIIPGETYTQGTPVNITFANSLMTASLWASCYPRLVGKAFEIGTVELTLGDPRLEPIDVLTVTDMAGVVHTVPCFNIHHHYNGGLMTTVSVPIDTDAEQQVTFLGPVEQAVKTLKRQVKNLQVAGSNAQYFWHNESGTDVSTGSYITEIPEAQFRADPDNGGGNLLARSNGLALRNGTDELATFTADGVQIGPSDINHTNMTPTAFESYGADGVRRLQIGDAVQGLYISQTIDQQFTSSGTITLNAAPLPGSIIYVYLDTYKMSSLDTTVAVGYRATARLTGGSQTTWGDPSDFGGEVAFDGNRTLTFTPYDSNHPQFVKSVLFASETGYGPAYTFGNRTEETAQGVPINYGDHSFTVGRNNMAPAPLAIVMGEGNYSAVPFSVVIGRYCDVLDFGNEAFMIGNGSSELSRGHALKVDWDGNLEVAGQVGTWKTIDVTDVFSFISQATVTGSVVANRALGLGYISILVAYRPTANVTAGANTTITSAVSDVWKWCLPSRTTNLAGYRTGSAATTQFCRLTPAGSIQIKFTTALTANTNYGNMLFNGMFLL